jgi:hypothetical protein
MYIVKKVGGTYCIYNAAGAIVACYYDRASAREIAKRLNAKL